MTCASFYPRLALVLWYENVLDYLCNSSHDSALVALDLLCHCNLLHFTTYKFALNCCYKPCVFTRTVFLSPRALGTRVC